MNSSKFFIVIITSISLFLINVSNALANQNSSQKSSLTQTIKEWVDIIIPLFGVPIALYTLAQGVSQYKKEQRWKRLEFIEKKYKEFENDLQVANVIWMIEWEKKELKYKESPSLYYFDTKILENSFEEKPEYNKAEVEIRDCFDKFLHYLDNFNAYIDTGLVQKEDFYFYLEYLLKIIANHPEAGTHKSLKFYQNLWNNFIYPYSYATAQLLSKYGYSCNLTKDYSNDNSNQQAQ